MIIFIYSELLAVILFISWMVWDWFKERRKQVLQDRLIIEIKDLLQDLRGEIASRYGKTDELVSELVKCSQQARKILGMIEKDKLTPATFIPTVHKIGKGFKTLEQSSDPAFETWAKEQDDESTGEQD